ncbi:glucokinase [Geomicrobium sp. JCM 19037]|uniref:ROK family glucokinase n=1 Tax=Geomicrobium sp. JCM 19037 TaxID=1460634 RepID=UPI00045F22AC|nr:ROK family glucokinase [Geomicrobium sp. JCM 19037]GAK03381.1 glucokinase [Geomicrobium sp. JCM 19037]
MTKYAIGADVGGTSVKMGIFTDKGAMIDKWSIPTDTSNEGVNISEDVTKSIREQLQKSNISKDQVIGVGVGVPGFVNEDAGRVDFAVNIGWRNYPLQNSLSEALHLPVYINNDANMAAAGEYWQGAGRNSRSAFCVTLGTGVGGGILLNGDVVNGPSGTGGEVGHVTVVPGGRLCSCGRRGCLEEYVGMKGFSLNLKERLASSGQATQLHAESEVSELFVAANAGDELAQAVIDESLYYLGLVLSNVVTLLNPEKIIIGGGISAAGDQLLEPLKKHYERFSLEQADRSLSFGIAELGNDAGIYGCAWLVINRENKNFT